MPLLPICLLCDRPFTDLTALHGHLRSCHQVSGDEVTIVGIPIGVRETRAECELEAWVCEEEGLLALRE